MKETIKVLMSRDGLSKAEATKEVMEFFNSMKAAVEEGSDLFEFEEIFTEEFGLEPDYFEDFVFAL